MQMALHNFQESSGFDPDVNQHWRYSLTILLPSTHRICTCSSLGKSMVCETIPVPVSDRPHPPSESQAGRDRSGYPQCLNKQNSLAITHTLCWSAHNLPGLQATATHSRVTTKSCLKALTVMYLPKQSFSPLMCLPVHSKLLLLSLRPWKFFSHLP